jgi:hypothetical protein
MIRLAPPVRDFEQDYRDLVGTRNAAVQLTLNSASRRVFRAYGQYADHTGNATFLSPIKWRLPGRSEALFSNYDGLRGSALYGELLAIGGARCPMCGFGEVSTLDHHLPRTAFPEFAILALNLVPACGRCNQLKGTHVGLEPGVQFLHPFFDSLAVVPVLVCKFSVLAGSALIEFRIRRTYRVAGDVLSRVRFQFSRLRLADRFRAEALAEIGERRTTFLQYATAKGPVGLRDYLRTESRGYVAAHGPNHWKSALYRSLARDNAFLSGGYEQIAIQIPVAPTSSQ